MVIASFNELKNSQINFVHAQYFPAIYPSVSELSELKTTVFRVIYGPLTSLTSSYELKLVATRKPTRPSVTGPLDWSSRV